MIRLSHIAVAALVGQLVVVLWLAPASIWRSASEPTSLATFITIAVTLLLTGARLAGTDRFDRPVLAVFLAGMPLVYAWAAILHGDRGDLGVEAIGTLVYVAFAAAGYARWPWLLGAGILAHGLAWDVWHYGRSTYIPDWYSAGCLATDLGVGVFALIAVRAPTRSFDVTRRAVSSAP